MSPSLEAQRQALLLQLTATCQRQQISLGEEIWQLDDLLRLIEYAAFSASDAMQALQQWCESMPLLGLAWYPEWRESEQELTISFTALNPSSDLASLWWLIQLWHLNLSQCSPRIHWWLEWPQRIKADETLPNLLPSTFGRQPALHVAYALRKTFLTSELQPLHCALTTVLHRLHRLGAQPRGLLERIKHVMEQALPARLSVPELAAHLALPMRSLQRQLQQHGTSHSQLLEDVRRNRAVSLLCHRQNSALKVGLMLGYQDAPSFQRAFRSWFGMSPGAYRQRYFSPADPQRETPAISLYYAINQLQHRSLRQYSGARIWLCLRNLAFDKSVQVLCEDKDGIWRPYAATFERFLEPEIELWSTPSLPVHDPLRFRIEYRTGTELYVDNNGGRDYCLDVPVLLGQHPVVCHQIIHFEDEDAQSRLLVRLFSRDAWPVVRATWQAPDGRPVHTLLRGEMCGQAWSWQGVIKPPHHATPLMFQFGTDEQVVLQLDNGGEGFQARSL